MIEYFGATSVNPWSSNPSDSTVPGLRRDAESITSTQIAPRSSRDPKVPMHHAPPLREGSRPARAHAVSKLPIHSSESSPALRLVASSVRRDAHANASRRVNAHSGAMRSHASRLVVSGS